MWLNNNDESLIEHTELTLHSITRINPDFQKR